MKNKPKPTLLILNQMAGPLTWEFAEDFARMVGPVAVLTGHPETLAKGNRENLFLFASTPYVRGNYFNRVFSWLRYWIHAFFWVWKWSADVPLLLFSNPPILCWLGRFLQLLRGQRYVIMVHDIYPDLLVRLGKGSDDGVVVKLWRFLNRMSYERAELVMTLGNHMAATLARSFNPAKTNHGRIETIGPWADTELIKPIPKPNNWFAQEHNLVEKITLMYSGNMGIGHDLETMLDVAKMLQHDQKFHFMFIGGGPKWNLVNAVVKNKALSNVTVLPWVPEKVLPFSLASADVGIVSLETELTGIAIPSKAFSFLSAGVPLIVVCGDRAELSDVVEEYNCGWRIHPKDSTGLHRLLLTLRDNCDLKDRRYSSRQAAEKIGSRKNSVIMADLISNVVNAMHSSSKP